MIVNVTKKLAEKMNISPIEASSTDKLLAWRAHIGRANRSNFVVFMHEETRFAVVLTRVTTVKLKKLSELFFETLKLVLLSYGINPEIIDWFIAKQGSIVFSRNTDAKKTAQLTSACEVIKMIADNNDSDISLSKILNYRPVGRDYYFPIEKMLEVFKSSGLPIYKQSAFELTIRLDLDGNDAIRKIRVPVDYTFEQLHHIIQKAYCWNNYHLYCFELYSEWPNDFHDKPDMVLTMYDDEDLEIYHNGIDMDGHVLSEFIPKYRKIIYYYDFGDGWHHYITVDEVIKECNEYLPCLINGEGDPPPEDVGGPYGFQEFLEIINNPNHDEYEEMITWAHSQGWKRFDYDYIVRRISSKYI